MQNHTIHLMNIFLMNRKKKNFWKKTQKIVPIISCQLSLKLWEKFLCIKTLSENTLKDALICISVQEFLRKRLLFQTLLNLSLNCPNLVIWNLSLHLSQLNISSIILVLELYPFPHVEIIWPQLMKSQTLWFGMFKQVEFWENTNLITKL